ncbi:MAG: hypothetical protein K2W82_15385 [Candidatus Obscuribacterales bacterium]|nr:hypothetical protein [Candidatus Obscuribacterales bacterium]
MSYHSGGDAALEPSAISLIAFLAEGDQTSELILKGILAKQNKDGGWSTNLQESSSDWTTFPAVIALQNYQKKHDSLNAEVEAALNRAYLFILNSRAEYYNDLGRIILWLWKGAESDYPRGFSWLPETADWVEPTAYAMLALKAGGPQLTGAQKRCLPVAERFLQKIACPEGGWNFGEHYPVGQLAVADPISTALALLALYGKTKNKTIKSSLNYLSTADMDKRGALSLAWSALALHAWKEPYDHILIRLQKIYDQPFSKREKILPAVLSLIALQLESNGNPFIFQPRNN